ncbi:MAG: DUF4404 family protein [Chloroflexota bacterium]
MTQEINQQLQQIDAEMEQATEEQVQSRAGRLRQRIDTFINGDPDNDDWNGLRDEILEAEAEYIESHPRLAAALRSIVAIVDNAGL